MHLKSQISATVIGLTLLASQFVAPAFAQQRSTPDTNTNNTRTISKDETATSELSASEAAHEQLVNEDIIEEVPQSQVGARALSAPRNFRERALKQALSQIGYKEQPFGSNCNKFSRYFGKGCQYWCANFVSWAFDSSGNGDKRVDWGNPSSVASILSWAKTKPNQGRLVRIPQPGDIFLIGVEHTGLVRSVSGTTFTTVEGNASNRVRSVKRPLSNKYKFVRVLRPQ